MQIQELDAAWPPASRWVLFCSSLAMALCLAACATDSAPVPTSDYSAFPSEKLLQVFLQDEQSKGAVQLSFSLVIQADNKSPERLRGVAAFSPCADLRVKLVGTVGLTVLDYLSVAGKNSLLVDKLTASGDAEAKQGLLDTMEVFTAALTGLCRPPGDFNAVSDDAGSIRYRVDSDPAPTREITLDRKRAVLIRQTVGGEFRPVSTISYGNFERIDDHWMPDTIAIKTEGSPVNLELGITRWRIDASLPADMFEAGGVSAATPRAD